MTRDAKNKPKIWEMKSVMIFVIFVLARQNLSLDQWDIIVTIMENVQQIVRVESAILQDVNAMMDGRVKNVRFPQIDYIYSFQGDFTIHFVFSQKISTPLHFQIINQLRTTETNPSNKNDRKSVSTKAFLF